MVRYRLVRVGFGVYCNYYIVGRLRWVLTVWVLFDFDSLGCYFGLGLFCVF